MVDLDSGQSSVLASNNAIPLTHGKFEVTEIIDWDEDNKTMWDCKNLFKDIFNF